MSILYSKKFTNMSSNVKVTIMCKPKSLVADKSYCDKLVAGRYLSGTVVGLNQVLTLNRKERV